MCGLPITFDSVSYWAFTKWNVSKGEQLPLLWTTVQNNLLTMILYQTLIQFYSPNTTSYLEPVDWCIGRSFKCDYRRLLVSHILAKVQCALYMYPNRRPSCNNSELVTSQHSVRILIMSLYLLRKRVVLKSWLKTHILSLQQRKDVEFLLLNCSKETVEPSMRSQMGSVTSTERSSAQAGAKAAKELYFKLLEEVEGNVVAVTESTASLSDTWDQ